MRNRGTDKLRVGDFRRLYMRLHVLVFIVGIVKGSSRGDNQVSDPFHKHHQPMCAEDYLRQCLSSLQSVTQSNEFVMVATKQQLIAACRKFKESLKCADSHMKRCFGLTERKVYNHMTAGARHLIRELCVSGKLQDEFLRHAECFNNMSRGADTCAAIFQKVQVLSESISQVQDVEQGLKATCCSWRVFVQCKSGVVIRECGPEAGSFLQKHLERISDPLIHEHCASFMYSMEDCAFVEHDRALATSSASYQLTSILLYTLVLLTALISG